MKSTTEIQTLLPESIVHPDGRIEVLGQKGQGWDWQKQGSLKAHFEAVQTKQQHSRVATPERLHSELVDIMARQPIPADKTVRPEPRQTRQIKWLLVFALVACITGIAAMGYLG